MSTHVYSQEFQDAITRIMKSNPTGAVMPSYRYFRGGKDRKDRYFWTTEKANHNGKLRYVAGVYRFVKTRNLFKLTKQVGFARRCKAKAWALAAQTKSRFQRV